LHGLPVAYHVIGGHTITTLGKLAPQTMDVSLVELDGTSNTESSQRRRVTSPKKIARPRASRGYRFRQSIAMRVHRKGARGDQPIRNSRPRASHGETLCGRVLRSRLAAQYPLEKSLLVGRESISGFASEPDAMGFAEHCSAYLSRPALPGRSCELVVRHINRYFEGKPALRTQIRNAGSTTFA